MCDCGARVEVPTFRQLREFPMVPEESAALLGPKWGLREGAMTVSLLLAAVCLVGAAMSRYSEQPVPEIDPVARTESVDRELESMTPVQAWQMWVGSYRLLSATGFEVYKHPAADYLQQTLDWHRAIQKTLVSIAAACVAAVVVLGFFGGGKAKA